MKNIFHIPHFIFRIHDLFTCIIIGLVMPLTANKICAQTKEIKAGQKVNKPDPSKFNYDRNFFIENKGQWPSEVLFMTQTNGLNAWVTREGVVYDFYKANENPNTEIKGTKRTVDSRETVNRHVIKISLEGNHLTPEIELNGKQNGYYNYLIGNDKSKWASNVGLYKEGTVKNIYSGIDQKFYYDNGVIRYDYLLKVGSNVNDIKMKIEGSSRTNINKEGEMVLSTFFWRSKAG